MKKNETYTVKIIDQGFEGEGIAKINDMTVFIEGAIKGEIVEILIVKVLTHFAYGKILNIVNKSDSRVQEDCSSYKKCGGCNLRHIKYETTLKIKKDIVSNCFYKTLHRDVNVNDCIGMKNPIGYRNKLIYPIGIDKNGNTTMGVFAKRSHDIVNIEKCYLQNELNNKIARTVFEWIVKNNIKPYNEQNNTGAIRHVIVRSGNATGEIMVVLVMKNEKLPQEEELINTLTTKYPSIKTIVKNINDEKTNVILGRKNIVIYGEGYIYDILGKYKFKISPLSFYQVNPVQTQTLYSTAVEYANLTGEETVFDLYCGIGTIGIFASQKAKQVYGIEVVEQAIKDAKENAVINNIENTEFMVGEVERLLPELVEKQEADVVFLDPPRKGCDKKALETLLKVEPKKIVYISCNPATLARDVEILEEKYTLEKVQPVDMFPYTSHVETVTILNLKNG